MSTCKDCIYYEVCKALNKEFKIHPKDYIETDLCAKQCTTFKDKSKFIELPCNIGDIVYRIFENASGKVIGKSKVIGVHSKRNNPCLIIDGWEMQNFKEIGKTVFLTEEEAEQALKECEKE